MPLYRCFLHLKKNRNETAIIKITTIATATGPIICHRLILLGVEVEEAEVEGSEEGEEEGEEEEEEEGEVVSRAL